MRNLRLLFPVLPILLTTLPALATVTQPNGNIMPVDSANGEIQIYTSMDGWMDGWRQSMPSLLDQACCGSRRINGNN